MKVPMLALYLLPGLLAVMAAGCSALGGAGGRHDGPPSISRLDFRGWQDAYRISNGEVEAIVVPQIARIMSFGPVGGESVLWVNEELTAESAGPLVGPPPGRWDWRNYGGYKLWPAPQKDWEWPPDWHLDAGPCQAEVTEEGVLRLVGAPSPRFGLRFDREISMAREGGRMTIRQIAVNVSDAPVRAAIWDVTQVKADCVGFVPLGPGAACRTQAGGPPDEQWRQVGDVLLVHPTGKDGKLFISGPPGWLGCKRGDLIYIKAFRMAGAPPPEPETPREVYTGDLGYVELEVVGPAVELAPGESTTLTETWHLIPAGPEASTDEGLVSVLRQQAQELGLE